MDSVTLYQTAAGVCLLTLDKMVRIPLAGNRSVKNYELGGKMKVDLST